MLLKDKVIIISGIGPGLGVKLAIEAAREGARVVIAARTQASLDDAEARMLEVAPQCAVLKQSTDITVPDQCQGLTQRALERFGRIDGLVNSAFVHGGPAQLGEGKLGELRAVFETNVLGTLNMTQAVVPALKQGGGGAIVMVNTMATRLANDFEAGYAASKGSLTTIAKYLALELGPHNIRVNSLLPGWMWGVPVQGYVKHAARTEGVTEEAVIARIAANIPLGRIVRDEECARAALFLVSDYASAISGAQLDANGGQFMAG